MKYLIILFLPFNFTFAQSSQLNLSDLRPGNMGEVKRKKIKVEQSEVLISGQRFKRVEYRGDFYYLQFLSDTSTIEPNNANCLRSSREGPSRIKVEIRRSQWVSYPRPYLETLRINCGESLSLQAFIEKLKDFELGLEVPIQEDGFIEKVKAGYKPVSNTFQTIFESTF